jgi:hypothetical protein
MHKFQLETRDGRDLGPVELARPDWPNGSVIYGREGRNLRVVDYRPSDGPNGLPMLVVEET